MLERKDCDVEVDTVPDLGDTIHHTPGSSLNIHPHTGTMTGTDGYSDLA